eukprot:Rmarinus@m.23739
MSNLKSLLRGHRWLLLGTGAVAGFSAAYAFMFTERDLDIKEKAELPSCPNPVFSVPRIESTAKAALSESSKSVSMNTSARPVSATPYLTPTFIADAVEVVMPAVVNIVMETSWLQNSGSGVIINADGTVITNAHVVDGSSGATLKVTLQDGRTFRGRVLACDEASDIAVIKLAKVEKPLPFVKFGDSSVCRPGEFVAAVGSPLRLNNSVSAGIISNVERSGEELGLESTPGRYSAYIQTDAAINSGNSGGPLINIAGEVIGINRMKTLGTDGISFAIPINSVKHVVQQLCSKGYVPRPYIGIRMVSLTPGITQQLLRKDPAFPDLTSGALVVDVIRRAPSEEAGIQMGDVITAINGRPVETTGDVYMILGETVGESINVSIQRGAKSMTLKVKNLERRA